MSDDSIGLSLALWREAGRHADATETVPAVGRLLVDALPVRSLRLDELSRDAGGLVTLAEWDIEDGLLDRQEAIPLSPQGVEELERWSLRGEVAERLAGQHWPAVLRYLDTSTNALLALAAGLRREDRLVGVVVMGTTRELSAAERALFLAALEPLAMVVGNDVRLRELHRLQARAEAERDALVARFGANATQPVLGAERGLRQVMERVRQVAPTNASVLILGETGSGKEVIARAIHEGSARAAEPFIRVNCGAVAPELIDSELFGHERGAFTGALAARRGWFERASGGTLFLDEIGELAPAVQVRLLRVLQDGIVQRVGGEQEIAVNVRVIAATHRDLPLAVQDGLFREDLWYRIAVFPIILPPLRERPEDLPELAAHFIERGAARAGLPVPPLTPQAIARLAAYDWPGNVRELGAVLERAVILGQGRTLEIDAALGSTRTVTAANGLGAATTVAPRGVPSFEQAVAGTLREAIIACKGRIAGPHGAAQLLGMNSNTFRSKMRKLGIRTEDVLQGL